MDVRGFFERNWRWLVTIFFFAGVFYGTTLVSLGEKATRNEVEVIVEKKVTKDVLPLIENNSENIRMLRREAGESLDLTKEIKFNLKVLMEANGLKYIEDTNK